MRSDLAWVVKVAADADDQLRAQVYGIPLTQDELALLDARATNAAQVGPTVERYGAEHLDEWAGAYVDDDPNVGVIARFTGNLAVHEAQLRTILNPNARFSVQTARWNKRQLISLSEQIARDSSWLESIGASFEAADVSIQDNAVILTVRADSDGVRAVIAERYDGEGGLTVMIVSRSPAWSGGFGSVAIAARSRTGDPVSGLMCEIRSDDPAAGEGTGSAWATGSDGTCRIPDVPAARYHVTLKRLVSGEWQIVGEGLVDVPDMDVGAVVITVQ